MRVVAVVGDESWQPLSAINMASLPWRNSQKPKHSVVPPVTLAVVGCGQRGKAYSRYALQSPERCKVVAIAEPRPNTQSAFATKHSVDKTLVFDSWQALLAASAETISTIGKRLADAVVIAVQDHMHLDVALAFAEQGYHILCEKPMATSVDHCIKMEAAIKNAGTIFGMGHGSKELSNIVHSRVLGDLVNVVHIEPVGYYHFAHSFVRGNWSNEAKSSFSLLTKSCHDIDILCHWFSPRIPTRVSSFGSLQHFRKSAKPSAAVYLDPVTNGNTDWPAATIVDGIPDIENITTALKTGPYGLCVYESANDVCDHQVVNLEFSDGSTASFTMVAYTSLICERQTRLHFTHGEIVGDMNTYTVTDFRTGKTVQHRPKHEVGGGHGGGDLGLIEAFVQAVATGRQEVLGTDVGEVLKSHLTVFAAEASRREGRVVDCAEFENEARRRVNGDQARA
ncbi:hypothetical protein D9615_000255 [Tricholomella constricta]|uniref:NAD(P)-binding protein n=1 Tax=Tricholomella constricta TaxID=117010 RepID=A0A8H5HS00_9AGAR|nr:hypothetical protein D9615_000255 [Tricholomella constricta]